LPGELFVTTVVAAESITGGTSCGPLFVWPDTDAMRPADTAPTKSPERTVNLILWNIDDLKLEKIRFPGNPEHCFGLKKQQFKG
jgi:hypothetical protein